ncbi:FAD-dependent oxidoreductase [Waterburya agarophytonicola K14]|uniref:FAD-dependent oxidoreductase n=1 Tax=Waterburya agarophytonicola KI4 TaxID=2874699 RepID=A0A964FIT2_9CYAN|nr:FAD-dependent oxidoreductase [Waterburya agarophytonicola]MCC0178694.1 FAD-dependent oxidoreductase [Waterburya agarophytonicola KI4]
MSSSNLQIINSDCIIIGSGITGLIIATVLQRKGIKTIVLDKNSEIGGRLATRTISAENSIVGIFDCGIQYFSVDSPQFQVWVDDWLEHNVIKQWSRGFAQGKEDGKPRYCGINGMSGIAQHLAQDLDVRTDTKANEISYEKKWLVETQGDQQYQGDMLVMTSSIPESLSLLDASFIPLPLEERFSLEQIEYDRCITVLALLEKPSNIPAPGGMILENEYLAWLGDNHQKGISPYGYGVTLHGTADFSNYYWDSDDAEIAYKLVTAAADYLDSSVIKYEVHRWRYLSPKAFYNQPFLTLLELPLIMAGDAFVASTVEGAVTSAIAAGESIGQRYKV